MGLDPKKNLKPQWEAKYGPHPGSFYLGNGITFMVIKDGPDIGKLTVAKSLEGKLVPDPGIIPVDCYNLMLPGEDIAAAVRRMCGNHSAYSNGHNNNISY